MDNFINQNSEKKVRERESKLHNEINWNHPQSEDLAFDQSIARARSEENQGQQPNNPLEQIAPEQITKAIGIVNTIKRVVFGGPLFLVGLIFFLVGVGASVSDANKSKDYVTTQGYYYDKEYSSLGGYAGTYSFEVDGKTYYVEYAQVESDPNKLPKEMTIKYDPKNPNNAVVKSVTWIRFAFMGFGIMLTGLVIMNWGKISKLLHLGNKVRMRVR